MSSFLNVVSWSAICFTLQSCAVAAPPEATDNEARIEILARDVWIAITQEIIAEVEHPVHFKREPMRWELLESFCQLSHLERDALQRGAGHPDQLLRLAFEREHPTWPAGLFAFMFAAEAPSRFASVLLKDYPAIRWHVNASPDDQEHELVTLSPLGIADDRMSAIVFFSTDGSHGCAAGSLLILDRVGAAWKIRRRVSCWIS